MNKFYDPTRISLHSIKNDTRRRNSLKGAMQIIFVLSFLVLVMLAYAKASGI